MVYYAHLDRKGQTMSNQRKAGKRNTNVSLTPTERVVLEAVRDSLGLSSNTDVIKLAIEELAKRRGIKQHERNENRVVVTGM